MSQTKAQLIDPVDGTIVNADINASAAIDGSKITPTFTSTVNVTNTLPEIFLTDTNTSNARGRLNANGGGLLLGADNDNAAADSVISFAVDGSERARIDSSGHLLFAGTSEEITLQTSDGSDNGFLNLSGGGACSQNRGAQLVLCGNERSGLLGTCQLMAGNAGSASSIIQFFTGGSEQARVDASGKLGIGTTSPSSLLHCNLAAENGSIAQFGLSGQTNNQSFIIKADDSDSLFTFRFGSSNSTYPAVRFNMGADAEAMRINSSGKVRIGSGDATYNLEVQGTGQQVILVGSTNANGAAIVLDGDSNGDGSGTDYSNIEANSSGNLVIHADNPSGNAVMMFKTGDSNEKMRLDDSGRLLLAATSGTARFHIKGNGGDGIKIENAGGTNGAVIDLKNTLTNYVKEYRLAVAGSDGAYGTAKALFVRDQTAGVNRFEIQDGGDVKVSTGNLIIGTAGKGIDFSASANPGGMTSELLNDYERGTFTATVVGIGGGTNPTFSAQTSSAAYIKVGDVVHYWAYIFDINCTSQGNNIVTVSGLPFASGGHYYPGVVTHNTITSNAENGYVQPNNNSPKFIIIGVNSTTGVQANTGNPKYIMIGGSYTSTAV